MLMEHPGGMKPKRDGITGKRDVFSLIQGLFLNSFLGGSICFCLAKKGLARFVRGSNGRPCIGTGT